MERGEGTRTKIKINKFNRIYTLDFADSKEEEKKTYLNVLAWQGIISHFSACLKMK